MRFRRPSAIAVLATAALLTATFGSVSATAQERAAAAPGLVEPDGEERQVASQVIGVISETRVEENDEVKAGDTIAVVENSEQAARLAAARAELARQRAELDKLTNGARPEERREARANLTQLDAELALAERDYQRKLPLARSGTSSTAELDQASSTLNATRARRAAVAEQLALIEAGARAEDIAAAKAAVAAAEAQVALAEALLAKTVVRSPIDGTILRRLRNVGEAVTNVDPTPIAVVGNLGRLRVRAEVDETDIGRIKAGQRVDVTADAFPGRHFGGAVFRVSQRLGAKQVQTGRPAEKVDMKVLQVLIDLDKDVKLPVGLRVDAYFLDGR
jgi:HlyD family secretion protein